MLSSMFGRLLVLKNPLDLSMGSFSCTVNNKDIKIYQITFNNLNEKLHTTSIKYSLLPEEIFNLVKIIKKEFEGE